MNFHIISLLPQSAFDYLNQSILKKAQEKKFINIFYYNLRDYSENRHSKVDDSPYGGGPGMVLNAAPILNAVKDIKNKININKKDNQVEAKIKIILFTPAGEKFDNKTAKKYCKKYTDIIFICGRYEGVDYRVKKILKAELLSIGDYVVTGGELPAMICIDTISRQIKNVLGDNNSVEENRISSSEMYTRPEVLEFENKKYKVPKVLLSGNHKEIDEWRLKTKK
jgi:tRNA (guanine37-N1)-methyltransferase